MVQAVPVLGSGVPTILSSPTVLEGQLSPLSCSGLPPTPPGFPSASPFQVLTLHKSEWGAEVVQLEMYYTQHGPGPAGVHPGRRRRCPWWGRGNWSLQERNRREEDSEERLKACSPTCPASAHSTCPCPHFTCIEFRPIHCPYYRV